VPKLDRLERLTDLVLVLLAATRPMTLDAIANEVPGYPEDHDARRQAFERDKRLLRDEGIPVSTEPVDGQEQFGYRIRPEAFYLPDLGLTPDEQKALHLAVAGVHLGDPSGRDALLKLGATGLAEARPVAAVAPPPALVALFEGVRTKAVVTFSYRGEARRVAPAALWFRGGRWYLVGWDLDRRAARTFRADRVEGQPRLGPPGGGSVPEGFDAAAAAPDDPWQPGEGAADDAVLRVDPVEAPRVVAEVGESSVVAREDDGSVLVRLRPTSHEVLRSWVLGMLDHVEVVAPPSLRGDIVAWLGALARSDAPTGAFLGDSTSSAAPLPGGAGPSGETAGEAGALASARHASGGPSDHPGPAHVTGGGGHDGSGAATPAAGRSRDARYRLRRLLAIVGWLARVGEASIADVAARFGIPEDEVVRELELAACCGLPPYTPDTLMEIEVNGDRVRAFLPDDLARPRRFSPAEGLALAAAARTVLAVPGADADGALARALAKLDAALGVEGGMVVRLDEPPLLGAARQAADRRLRVELEYHSASTDETTRRIVDPVRAVSLDGHWYLDGHCHRAGSMRRFRVDRIRSLHVLGEQPAPSGPPPDLSPDAFVPGPGATSVRLLLDEAAAWVVDSVPTTRVEVHGGSVDATLEVGGRAWLERLLLQLGPHARVIDPPELADLAARAARRVLRRYREAAVEARNNMKKHGNG